MSTGPGTVSGAYAGIQASNFGSQALKITTTGDVTGINNAGIYALNGNDAVHPGTYLSITTGPGTISGGLEGIKALNYGSGALTITTNGDVTGTGVTSTGIYARAVNGISIAVNEGTVSGVAAGVQIVDGGINSLKSYGTVESSAGPSGTAIVAGTGNETVDNFGTITGSVDLGAGANAFTNRAGALFNSGPIVNVGVGSLFANDGTIDPGDPGNVLTTSLTANFVQSSSGVFVVDLNGTAADLIAVAGTANVAGLVKPNVISLGSSKQWTILTATSGVLNDGITGMDTPTIDFDLTFPKANEMDLVIAGVNFLLVGQNRNEQAIANNLNQFFAAGVPPSMQVLFNALALLPTADAVANALDKLSPEVYLDSEIAELYAQLNFTNTIMTCPTRDGAVAFIKEGECLWARASGRAFDQESTFQTFGFDETSWQFATGAQFALGPVWRIGGAFGYEHANLETDTNAKTEGDRFDGGAVLKYNPRAFLLAAGVSGGVGSYDVSRPITFPGFHASSEGDSNIGTVDGRLRAAYLLTVGSWYAKPVGGPRRDLARPRR